MRSVKLGSSARRRCGERRVKIDDTLAPASGGTPIWSVENLPWRLAEVAAAGALGGVLMIMAWLGVRADLATAVQTPVFWLKVGYAAILAISAAVAVCRLARGRPRGLLPLVLAGGVVVGFLVLGVAQAFGAGSQPPARPDGPSAFGCILSIVAIATPILLFASYGLASIDPERPRLVGLAGGFACGAVADLVFGLHCPSATFAFIAPWHTAGMLTCGLAGVLLLGLFRRIKRPRLEEVAGEE